MLLITPALLFSQVDTIYSNTSNKIFFVFQSPIKQATTGNYDFYFGYNKQTPSKIAHLTAAKKTNELTNLFVVTQDEKMYSFLIGYKRNINPNDMVKRINQKKALNNFEVEYENTRKTSNYIVNSKPIANADYDLRYSERKTIEENYATISDNILLQKRNVYKRTLTVLDNLYFRLKNYYSDKEEVYFLFEIDNKSKIDFDINFIKFFAALKKKKKRVLEQQIFLGENGSPIYTHKLPKRIKPGETKQFVCVFKKTPLSRDKIILVNLSELKGERVLELELDNRIVNYPRKLKFSKKKKLTNAKK